MGKSYRQRHIEQGLCVRCTKEAEPGYLMCKEHIAKSREHNLIYYQKNKEKIKARIRNLKKRYEEEGRCRECSMPILEEDLAKDYLYCENCRMKRSIPKRPKYQHILEFACEDFD